ncbi:MAG TPA: hypothetical protein VH436_19655, partial [Vicinamibacterales bacterium]
MKRHLFIALACAGLAIGLEATAIAQRGAGGRGAPATARTAAPIDITGVWVSVVTEDWRWRMVTPPKGDYASVPLNAAATKV